MAARAVAVIGPGALGLLYASRLSEVVPTALIARNAARATELRRGVRVGGRLYKPDAFGPEELPRADWVIVLVKTHQSAAAIRVVRVGRRTARRRLLRSGPGQAAARVSLVAESCAAVPLR